MVAPVGAFVNDGTAFRYFEISKMAVFNGTTPLPTVDWLEFKTCKLITQYTDNGVFSMDLADAIYIGSTYTVKIEMCEYDLMNIHFFFSTILCRKTATERSFTENPFLFTGISRDAYETLERAVREGPWATLLDCLRDLIHTDDRQMVAQAELSRQTQGGKNVDIFFRFYKEICWKAYPGADASAIRDAILKSTFINGLQEEIRHHVQRGMPRDAEQALQIPKREESLRNISTTDSLS
ncbi:hypothetical protein B9Z55_011022 [Caenorhabditis nigoni]|nr:hypothetical protein B9Z55_011022 [Caenorhabditis nigoni]